MLQKARRLTNTIVGYKRDTPTVAYCWLLISTWYSSYTRLI